MKTKTYAEWVSIVTNEAAESLGDVTPESLERLRNGLRRARRIFTAGKGRSGLCLRAFAMRLMHLGLNPHVVDDVTTPSIGTGDLLLLASGSGRTASLLSYASAAKTQGASVYLITAHPASPLAQQAEHIIHIPAPSVKAEHSIGASAQPMANRFEQSLWLVLDITSIQMMEESGLTEAQLFARHANLE